MEGNIRPGITVAPESESAANCDSVNVNHSRKTEFYKAVKKLYLLQIDQFMANKVSILHLYGIQTLFKRLNITHGNIAELTSQHLGPKSSKGRAANLQGQHFQLIIGNKIL